MKQDLLGVFGHTGADPENLSRNHILSLGFIVNGCPGRELLDDERDYLANHSKLHLYEAEVERVAENETVT